MKRPLESNYTSHVAYTRALEVYCDGLESQGPRDCILTEVEYAHHHGWPLESQQRLVRMVEAQRKIPPVQPAQRKPLTDWVGVEDRLPQSDGYYLVTVATDDGPHVDVLVFNSKLKHWEHEGEPTFCHSYYFEPTHWAMRPEAAHGIKENA